MKKYVSHLGFAFRIIAKTPLISILSIFVLAISIALVSLMFNMVSSVLLSKLPWDGSERLTRIERINPSNQYVDTNMPFQSYHEFLEIQNAFEGTIAFFNDSVIINYEQTTKMERAIYVSSDFLDVLGEDLQMGRRFTPEDALADSPQVIIISHNVWNNLFGGDPDIVGKTVSVDGEFRTIVGVTQKDFDFPFVTRAWIPLNTDTLVESVGWGSSVMVLGKRKPEVSLEGANAQMNDVFLRLKEKFPTEHENYDHVRVTDFKDMWLDGGTRELFVAMGICAVLVLFMGSAISSNLMTVRCSKRANELAIRSALGASRTQIVVQMLFESLLTSIISIVLGWLLMIWFDRAVCAPYYEQFSVPSWFFDDTYSLSHVIFVVVLLLVVTITSTLIPALRASKTSLNDLLKDSTRTGSSLRMSMLGRFLIIFQIAAAFAVVTGGAIVGYFLHDVSSQELDYDPNAYLYATLTMNANTHGDPNERVQLWEKVKQELLSNPEVNGVTYSTEYYWGYPVNAIQVEGVEYPSEEAYPKVYRRLVGPGHFEVMDIDLIAGREFNEFDMPDSPRVAIVTDVFAQKFWPDENPLGKRFSYTEGDQIYQHTVVGIVKDLFQTERDRDNRVGFFMAAYQDPWFDIGIHIKHSGNPNMFESTLVQTVSDIDSMASVSDIGTIQQRMETGLIQLEFIFVIFVTFSLGALLMATAGLYGVVAFSVAQRIKEIAIRLALGAAPGRVIASVFGQGFINVIVGMLIGVVLAYGLRYLLMMVLNPLYESLFVYMAVLVGILFASCISILIPAVQGGSTDPADALRID